MTGRAARFTALHKIAAVAINPRATRAGKYENLLNIK